MASGRAGTGARGTARPGSGAPQEPGAGTAREPGWAGKWHLQGRTGGPHPRRPEAVSIPFPKGERLEPREELRAGRSPGSRAGAAPRARRVHSPGSWRRRLRQGRRSGSRPHRLSPGTAGQARGAGCTRPRSRRAARRMALARAGARRAPGRPGSRRGARRRAAGEAGRTRAAAAHRAPGRGGAAWPTGWAREQSRAGARRRRRRGLPGWLGRAPPAAAGSAVPGATAGGAWGRGSGRGFGRAPAGRARGAESSPPLELGPEPWEPRPEGAVRVAGVSRTAPRGPGVGAGLAGQQAVPGGKRDNGVSAGGGRLYRASGTGRRRSDRASGPDLQQPPAASWRRICEAAAGTGLAPSPGRSSAPTAPPAHTAPPLRPRVPEPQPADRPGLLGSDLAPARSARGPCPWC